MIEHELKSLQVLNPVDTCYFVKTYLPVRETCLVPLGRTKRILLCRTVVVVRRPAVPMTMCAVMVDGRRDPVSGREEVCHAAARPLHRGDGLGVQAARLVNVGDSLEMSDRSAQFFLRPQRSCLQVGCWQVSELHQVHLPQKTRHRTLETMREVGWNAPDNDIDPSRIPHVTNGCRNA